MKVDAGPRPADEPIDGFEAPMRTGIVIVDAERRRMRDQDIQLPAVAQAVSKQPWRQRGSPEEGLALRILVHGTGPVTDAAPEAGEQDALEARRPKVDIQAAGSVSLIDVLVVGRIMVSRHIEDRDIHESDDVLQVCVREVTAADDEPSAPEVSLRYQLVDAVNHLIAYRKDLHDIGIVP